MLSETSDKKNMKPTDKVIDLGGGVSLAYKWQLNLGEMNELTQAKTAQL